MHRRRRIEAHRLLEHRVEQGKLADVLAPDSAIAGDARYLLAQLLLPLREQRQQIERPGQSLRGGLMSGNQEGDDIVDDQPIGHRLAAGGIARADEPLQQVVALHLARPRFGKHAFSDAAHDFAVSRHRARCPDGESPAAAEAR